MDRLIHQQFPDCTSELIAEPVASHRDDHQPDEFHGLENLELIECPDTQAEAGVIALLMRETLETRDKTAALVTSDRELARRVAAALRRWDIAIDDSAGQPLADTSLGVFLRLIAAVAAEGAAPVFRGTRIRYPGFRNRPDAPRSRFFYG